MAATMPEPRRPLQPRHDAAALRGQRDSVKRKRAARSQGIPPGHDEQHGQNALRGRIATIFGLAARSSQRSIAFSSPRFVAERRLRAAAPADRRRRQFAAAASIRRRPRGSRRNRPHVGLCALDRLRKPQVPVLRLRAAGPMRADQRPARPHARQPRRSARPRRRRPQPNSSRATIRNASTQPAQRKRRPVRRPVRQPQRRPNGATHRGRDGRAADARTASSPIHRRSARGLAGGLRARPATAASSRSPIRRAAAGSAISTRCATRSARTPTCRSTPIRRAARSSRRCRRPASATWTARTR